MEVSDLVSVGISSASKMIIEKGIDKITRRASKIEQNITDAFTIDGREMTILCPESVQKYSLSIISKNNFSQSKARFELGKVRRAEIRSVVGLESHDAINILESGFELKLSELQYGQRYLLDVEYAIEDPNFLDSLVNRAIDREAPNENNTEYWMVAQLKHLSALKSEYGRIDLRDVDFNVDVGIHQDVNTKVPDDFKDQLKTIVELLQKKGRDEKFKLYHKLLSLQNKPHAGHEFEILGSLVALFSPPTFKKFINVSQDFQYYKCEKSTNVYDYSFMVWPKFMKVTSRTDLGLHKPASKGTLVYKKTDFMSEIEDLFKK